MLIAGAYSGLGWILFGAMVLLVVMYLYFWAKVVHARRHRHVAREVLTDVQVAAALDKAVREGRTHRLLIQVTTKGGAPSVVMRGIDHVLAGVAAYPTLRGLVRVEVVTEDPADVAAFDERYADAPVRVDSHLLPADYETPRGTRLKARALHFMVELHRREPEDCYVVHYDEESVLMPHDLARMAHQLMLRPVGISSGMISYGLDWDHANLVNKTMESNRPFGCHECYSVMTRPPVVHLHGSNLVIRQDLENEIGWDIGTLDGAPLIAEDLVFGLESYLRFGPEVFGWHHTEMVEQPPFTLKAAFKQRERWVFGALQALAHLRTRPAWLQLPRRTRWRILATIRGRVATYALGFPVSVLALGGNLATLVLVAAGRVDPVDLVSVGPGLSVFGVVMAVGLVLWLSSTQLGLWHNHRYAGLSRLRRLREHLLVLVTTPVAGVIDTAGPMVAVVKWWVGVRAVAWQPTPKLAGEVVDAPVAMADPQLVTV